MSIQSSLRSLDDDTLVSKDRKQVAFQTVTIYSFPVGIGQNPSVSSGCPIALKGFEAIDEYVEDIDVYQYERSAAGEMRSHRQQLRLDPQVRTSMLVQQGYSFGAIVSATAAAMEIRALRDESIQKSSWDEVKRFFGGGSKQKSFASRMSSIAAAGSPRRSTPTKTAKSA